MTPDGPAEGAYMTWREAMTWAGGAAALAAYFAFVAVGLRAPSRSSATPKGACTAAP